MINEGTSRNGEASVKKTNGGEPKQIEKDEKRRSERASGGDGEEDT